MATEHDSADLKPEIQISERDMVHLLQKSLLRVCGECRTTGSRLDRHCRTMGRLKHWDRDNILCFGLRRTSTFWSVRHRTTHIYAFSALIYCIWLIIMATGSWRPPFALYLRRTMHCISDGHSLGPRLQSAGFVVRRGVGVVRRRTVFAP